MARKVCAEPNCPALTDRTRCPEHARQADRARGTRRQRGYDRSYDRIKRAWQRRIDAGEIVHCWRCGIQLHGRDWHLGHDDHDRTVIRGPECAPCNLSAAGRASHR